MTESLYRGLHQATLYLEEGDQKKLQKAYHFAEKAHWQQKRKTGHPYITHPVAVAKSLADLHLDVNCLIAALLHDVIEDTEHDAKALIACFGPEVVAIVDGVSRLEGLNYLSIDERQAANFSKMLVAMAKDMRVILIKLADRLHNLETLSALDLEQRKRIALETLQIYAPLAEKMGLNFWRLSLEDNAFLNLYPNRYQVIKKAIQVTRGRRNTLISNTRELIENRLLENDIEVIEIQEREKPPYSVFQKMKKKGVQFTHLVDLFAFRVVVKSVDQCYRSLGHLHGLYRPVPNKFKDYIALPKPNGYQSLHTVLIDQDGIQAEVQIRTSGMHHNAEYGFASHWRYKGGVVASGEGNLPREWLNSLLDLKLENPDKLDFWESVKQELMPHEVSVFTPQGKIVNLPYGATVIDFAYAIHSKIGHHAIGCEVNQQSAELYQILKNGDIVHVFTNRARSATTGWLEFACTAKARSAIRNQLKKLETEELRKLGKKLYDQAITECFGDLVEVPEYAKQALLEESNLSSEEQLYLVIGRGERPAKVAVDHLKAILGKSVEPKKTTRKDTLPKGQNIVLGESGGAAFQFARCCTPVYGDKIIGFLNLDKGLVIHRIFCPNYRQQRKNLEKWIEVQWGKQTDDYLKNKIRVFATPYEGLFADIVDLIAKEGIEIHDVDINQERNKLVVDFELSIRHRNQLAQLLRLLRQLPKVEKVMRRLS